jgi:hypothetical protein
LLVLNTDHITGATGLSPTVQINKNGTGWGVPAGAVTEVGFGLYQVAPNAVDANTLGPLQLYAIVPGVTDPANEMYPVNGYNPWGLGLAADGLNNILIEMNLPEGLVIDDNGNPVESFTMPQALAVMLAVFSGGGAGFTMGPSLVSYQQAGNPGGVQRVQATIDIAGNRQVVLIRVPVTPA